MRIKFHAHGILVTLRLGQNLAKQTLADSRLAHRHRNPNRRAIACINPWMIRYGECERQWRACRELRFQNSAVEDHPHAVGRDQPKAKNVCMAREFGHSALRGFT